MMTACCIAMYGFAKMISAYGADICISLRAMLPEINMHAWEKRFLKAVDETWTIRRDLSKAQSVPP